jgi:hypothetical protein
MKNPSPLSLLLIIACICCSEEKIESHPPVSATVDGTPWVAKGVEVTTEAINGVKAVKTITAYNDQGAKIVISIDRLALSPANLSASFRKKTAILQSFTANVSGTQTIFLSWTTSYESSINYFEIQRSFDNIYFSAIDYISSHGSEGAPADYQYVHQSQEYLIEYKVYFRLKIVDYNGFEAMSETVEVKLRSEVYYLDPFGKLMGGYNGRVELTEFDLQKKTLSGNFFFTYDDNRPITVTNGVLNNITW